MSQALECILVCIKVLVSRTKTLTSTRRPIIYPSGKIIAHDKRYT